jgi:hypothetical protein
VAVVGVIDETDDVVRTGRLIDVVVKLTCEQ